MRQGPNQQLLGIVGVIAVILIGAIIVLGISGDLFGTPGDNNAQGGGNGGPPADVGGGNGNQGGGQGQDQGGQPSDQGGGQGQDQGGQPSDQGGGQGQDQGGQPASDTSGGQDQGGGQGSGQDQGGGQGQGGNQPSPQEVAIANDVEDAANAFQGGNTEDFNFVEEQPPGTVADGFWADNTGTYTRYVDGSGNVYYTFTPRQGGQGQGGGQAGDTDVGGPGGSECEHAENCTKQDNPGNSGSTTINSDVTHITFKAGQDEFDVPVPTTSGETNCNAGYCVTLNPDGSISWSSDGARRDISHMQYWEGGTNGGTDTTGTTTTGTDTTGTDTTGGGTGNDPCTDDNPNNDNNCEDGTTTGGHTPITICHIPPGNPENAHTITIDESALPAHLAHGDYPGGCSGGGTGGPTGGGTGGPTGGDTTAGPEPPQDTTGTDTTGGPTGGGTGGPTGGGTGGPTGGGTGINPNPPAMAASGVCDAGGGGVTYIVSNPGNVAIPAQPYSILDDNGNVVANGVLPGIPPGGSQSVSFPTGATTGTFTLSVGVLNATADMTDNCRVEVASIPQYLCGGVTLLPGGGAGPGFPIINMDPENCGPDAEQLNPDWVPVEIGEAVCPDWLLYHTNQTGDWEVFRLGDLPDNPDADPNVSQGVGPAVIDLAPSLSPDGKWFAFASTRDGNWEIYVGTTDGTFQQRATVNDQSIDLDPVWSPDGTSIVYESNVNGNWELWVLDVVTGEMTQLTDHQANDINAFWSPDNSKIVFESDREDGLWQIYEYDFATGEITRLSDGTGDDHDPQYSNDGSLIAFRSTRDSEFDDSTIYIMNADGTDLMQVSETGGNASNHVFSSDDDLIAYQSDLVNGVNDIYVYQISTGETRLLTNNEGVDYASVQDVSPTWYCESTTVVWTSDVEGDNNIYSYNALPIEEAPINVDQDAAQLTDDPGNDRDPENTPPEENASRGGALPPMYTG